MQSFVITGGCGFIGANLVKSLLNTEDDNILVIDNLTSGTRGQLGSVTSFYEISAAELGNDNPSSRVTFLKGDVRDKDLAQLACQGADTVIHLAASTGVISSIEDPRSDCMDNVVGTLNYLESGRISQIRRFVFASSSAPLGQQTPPIHEEKVPKPISPYGASKMAGEAYCIAYHGSFGLDTVVLRFGNVYGPYSTHKKSVVAKFIKHILSSKPIPIYGDGNQTRDFIYVDDLIQSILLTLELPNIGGQIFQIATSQEHSVVEVAEELNCLAKKYIGRKSEIVFGNERKGEIRRNYSDISKARKILGFEPRNELKQGLEKTFLWFLQNQKSKE